MNPSYLLAFGLDIISGRVSSLDQRLAALDGRLDVRRVLVHLEKHTIQPLTENQYYAVISLI